MFYRLANEHASQLVTDAIHQAEHALAASPATTAPRQGASRDSPGRTAISPTTTTRKATAPGATDRTPMTTTTSHGAHAVVHAHPGGLRGVLHSLFVPHSHDAADSVDDALEASNQGIRAVKLSLGLLGLTALLQVGIVVISGSVALLADTIHNFSDALTAVPLWVAFVIGRRPASRRYTYGYGRIEDLAGLFIVAMIAISAVVAGVESIRRFVEPQPVTNLGWVLAAGLIGFAGNELVAVYRIRVGRRIGSAALVADGVHARTDGFTSLAVVLGVIGIWLGFPLADPIVGLLISAAIVVLLIGTSRDIGRRLLDGVDPGLVEHRRAHRRPGARHRHRRRPADALGWAPAGGGSHGEQRPDHAGR